MKRSTLILALLSFGCSSTSDPATGDVILDLQHDDPRVRVSAALLAEENSDPARRADVIYLLIANLSHLQSPVRMYSAIALRKLTGKAFGYEAYAESDEREQAIARWSKWAESEVPS